MKSIIYTLALFSCGQEKGESTKEIIENKNENTEQVDSEEKQTVRNQRRK